MVSMFAVVVPPARLAELARTCWRSEVSGRHDSFLPRPLAWRARPCRKRQDIVVEATADHLGIDTPCLSAGATARASTPPVRGRRRRGSSSTTPPGVAQGP